MYHTLPSNSGLLYSWVNKSEYKPKKCVASDGATQLWDSKDQIFIRSSRKIKHSDKNLNIFIAKGDVFYYSEFTSDCQIAHANILAKQHINKMSIVVLIFSILISK